MAVANSYAPGSLPVRYGFKNVIIPADILHAQPSIFPFDPLLKHVYAEQHRPLPAPLWTPTLPGDVKPLRIDAAMVLNDPRDWALDIQILVDIIGSEDGILGKPYGPERLADKSPLTDTPIYFSNPDMVWATAHHTSRLAQGAFRAAVSEVWRETRPKPSLRLQDIQIGKPRSATYTFAERLLDRYRERTFKDAKPLKKVYMVGDNPASDIMGANTFNSVKGVDWVSVLVKTGVWKEERGPPSVTPRMIADDVRSAVMWALEQEGVQATIEESAQAIEEGTQATIEQEGAQATVEQEGAQATVK